MTVFTDILAHAQEFPAVEVCGLIVVNADACHLIRAKNLYTKPREGFELDSDAWLEVGEGDEVVGIYHSHPFTNAEPSMHDLVMCEASNLPWHIVNPETQEHRITNPSGYLAPYTKRPYVHGVLDCYAVVRDWYTREWGLNMPDYPRQDGWWDKGASLYLDHFAECGFVQMSEGTPLQVGDAFLIQHGARVPNHAAVYTGDGQILHHVYGRLSDYGMYGGTWSLRTTHHLRHESRIKNG